MSAYLKVSIAPGSDRLEVEGQTSYFTTETCIENISTSPFSRWQLDGDIVSIESDYSGFQPLYYFSNSKTFCISNSLPRLLELGAPRDFDLAALALFCRLGFFVGERTPFSSIRATPPNARMTWRNGRLDIKGEPRIIREQAQSIDSIVDGYCDLFSQSISRNRPLNQNFDHLLSGGRDSRQTLLELLEQGHKPRQCITTGIPKDKSIAESIAQRLDLPLRFVSNDNQTEKASWEKNLATNFCSLEHGWLLPLANFLETECIEAYEGTGVGVLTRSELLSPEYLDLVKAQRYDELAERLCHNIGPLASLFQKAQGRWTFLHSYRDEATQMLSTELQRFREAANPITAFGFWNWNRRGISQWPFALANRKTLIHSPFLDRDLYDHVASVPARIVREQEPQTLAIQRKFKTTLDLPYDTAFDAKHIRKRSLRTNISNWSQRVYHTLTKSPENLRLLAYCRASHDSQSSRNASASRSALQFLYQLWTYSD